MQFEAVKAGMSWMPRLPLPDPSRVGPEGLPLPELRRQRLQLLTSRRFRQCHPIRKCVCVSVVSGVHV
eukprot:2446267-Pleurochrysis_carterae.AAC.2